MSPQSITPPVDGELKRALSLPLMVLYGLGVTIGAGIYVLIGATSGLAGAYAPLSFVVAAVVMLPSACSFAELVGRYPLSAGEAAYVRGGLGSDRLALAVGLLVVLVGTVSAAAICIGSTGYLRQFVDLPQSVLLPAVVLAMAAIAAWGVRESVSFAAVMTVVEVLGLIAVIAAGLVFAPDVAALSQVPHITASYDQAALTFAVLSGAVIAFFAFVGFEDLVNMAEETHEPARTLPAAIFLTLAISTAIYVLVAWVAVRHVAPAELAQSEAPLSLVFARTTGASAATISAIAIVATLNGVIVQIVMASRVIYGLARQGQVPAWLGHVNAVTRTPMRATGLIAAIVLVLATAVPLTRLAEATTMITLSIFTLVNLSLLRLKMRGEPAPDGTFLVPGWVPLVGAVSAASLLVVGAL